MNMETTLGGHFRDKGAEVAKPPPGGRPDNHTSKDLSQ